MQSRSMLLRKENCGLHCSPSRQRGVSLVLMAVSLIILLGFVALAVDGGNLYVARNELQDAADAGALAGARVLYLNDGSAVNPGCNQVATDTAAANNSQGTPVEVASVRRGHWSFATHTFTPNTSLAPVDLFNETTAELDADPNFINAVEVVTARNTRPVEALFGRIFGRSGYPVSARAVAYLGFAGTLRPQDVDEPIAICKQKLLQGGAYNCSIGRFISSSATQTVSETGGWASLLGDYPVDQCSGGTSTSELRPQVCSVGNPDTLSLGRSLATLGGQSQSTFQDMYDCWAAATGKQRIWNMTLPVIDCSDGNVGPCNALVGAVNVNVVWMVNQANNINADAPYQMGDWSSADSNGVNRWDSFVAHFNLRKPDGSLATWSSDPQQSGYQQKTMYFLPDCEYHKPTGVTGGENFGVLAQIPVLVQ